MRIIKYIAAGMFFLAGFAWAYLGVSFGRHLWTVAEPGMMTGGFDQLDVCIIMMAMFLLGLRAMGDAFAALKWDLP